MKTILLAIVALSITAPFLRAEPNKQEPLVECPQCKGLGEFKCNNASCTKGTVLCPGHCLKRERGNWVHLKVEGHSDKELWQRFDFPNGQWRAWTQAHVGEKVELRGSEYVNTGKCELCNRTTRVKCPVCKGSNTCSLCAGALQVLQSERDRYLQAHSASGSSTIITVKDGQLPEGQIIARSSGTIMIKTKDGRILKVKTEPNAPIGAKSKAAD